MLLHGKVYDVLKWIVQIVLPAVATLYFALASIWGLPKAEEVIGTVAAVATFLGIVLKLSSVSYNNAATVGGKYAGVIKASQTDGKTLYSLEFNIPDPTVYLNENQEALFQIAKS